jgi:hypothetical protein
MMPNDTTLRHRHDDVQPLISPPRSVISSSTPEISISQHSHLHHHNHNHHGLKVLPASPAYLDTLRCRDHHFGQQYMLALTLAGMCCSLLYTVFGLFHVDVFLRVYQLPWHSYSVGMLIFAVISTANDVLGAWFLDTAATKMNRSDLIGVSGCIFSLFFL